MTHYGHSRRHYSNIHWNHFIHVSDVTELLLNFINLHSGESFAQLFSFFVLYPKSHFYNSCPMTCNDEMRYFIESCLLQINTTTKNVFKITMELPQCKITSRIFSTVISGPCHWQADYTLKEEESFDY